MMPEPLTPATCDLQDFPFMPLHVARLRDSDFASEEHPEACWYAVMLWAASWHQIPAASLPNNDAILARLCGLGRDVRTFKKHKVGALRGFILCSDDRLYHPVVAEQAKEAWQSKLQQRWRTACARIKKSNQRKGLDDTCPEFEEWLSLNCPDDVPEDKLGTSPPCPSGNGIQETGTGTGIYIPLSKDNGEVVPKVDPEKQFWTDAKAWLVERGKTEAQAGSLVGKWLREQGKELTVAALNAGQLERAVDPVAYVTGYFRRHSPADGGQPSLIPMRTSAPC